MAEKTTLPWLDQYPGWLLYSLGVPQGANVFKQVKPNMYKQTFPGQDPSQVFGTSPLSRLGQDYNPWAALGTTGRDTTGQESDILNRSLFGQTAPLDLGNVRDAQAAKNNLVTSFASGGKYNQMADEIYNSMGGKLSLPTAPSLDQLGALPTGQDIGNTIFNAYNRFGANQPGFQSAMQQSLRGGDILQTALAAMKQQGGAMDQYVNPLVKATEDASRRALANANTEMMSRFAGEGAFMSGPMLSALANQSQDYGVNLAEQLGKIRLQAANDQANRIYTGATNQANIQAEQARALSDQYARMAQETGSQQAALASSAYKAKADFLSNQYNTQMGAFTQQNAMAQQQVTQRAADLMQQYGLGIDQAMKIAESQQKNEQSTLDNLKNNYLQPGQEILAILKTLMGFPSVSKTTGGGFDIGNLVAGIGGNTQAAKDTYASLGL